MMAEATTLFQAAVLHLAQCAKHEEQPAWLKASLRKLQAAVTAHSASQAARVAREKVGRPRGGKDAEIRELLLQGASGAEIQARLHVGGKAIQRVRVQLRNEPIVICGISIPIDQIESCEIDDEFRSVTLLDGTTYTEPREG